MLRTVIIDDEDLIRQGLRQTIPWQELSFEIVGEAADGEEAIEVLQNTMPDVIITDIRMPFMSGLELVEFIKPMLPDTFIIVLSGHDEFHYAQKALQLGVYDYILKPFDLDYFEKILKKIKYDHTLRKKRKVNPLPPEDLSHLQENFISTLLLDPLPPDQLEAKLEGYQLTELKDRYFSTLMVQIDNFHLSIADVTFDRINEINKTYYNILQSIVPPSVRQYVIEGNAGDAVIVLSGATKEEAEMKSAKVAAQLRDALSRQTDHSVTLAVSKVLYGIASLDKLYRQSHTAANQRFMVGYNQNILYKDLARLEQSRGGQSNFPQIGFDRGQYLSLVKSGDPQKITAYIADIFNTLIKKGHNSSLYTTMFVSAVYVELLNLLSGYGLSIGDIYDDPMLVYRDLTISKNLYDTKDILTDLSANVAEYIRNHTSNKGNSRIEEAKLFIENNYSSPDITLQMVAEEVNMGVCYFSSTFKKETGESFINYLTGIRIDKAKHLFETTDLKTYEVSYMVGYNTPTYFSTLFKKITGVSPSEFRNV